MSCLPKALLQVLFRSATVSSALIATTVLLCWGADFVKAAELAEPQEVVAPVPEDLQAESYSALDLQMPTVSELTPVVSFTNLDTDLETEVNQIAQSEVTPSEPQEELPEDSEAAPEAESGGANTRVISF